MLESSGPILRMKQNQDLMKLPNETFLFLKLHVLLRSGSAEKHTNIKSMFMDDVYLSELSVEIAKFNRLVQSKGITFQSDASAMDVLGLLTKCRLCDLTPYFLCLKG